MPQRGRPRHAPRFADEDLSGADESRQSISFTKREVDIIKCQFFRDKMPLSKIATWVFSRQVISFLHDKYSTKDLRKVWPVTYWDIWRMMVLIHHKKEVIKEVDTQWFEIEEDGMIALMNQLPPTKTALEDEINRCHSHARHYEDHARMRDIEQLRELYFELKRSRKHKSANIEAENKELDIPPPGPDDDIDSISTDTVRRAHKDGEHKYIWITDPYPLAPSTAPTFDPPASTPQQDYYPTPTPSAPYQNPIPAFYTPPTYFQPAQGYPAPFPPPIAPVMDPNAPIYLSPYAQPSYQHVQPAQGYFSRLPAPTKPLLDPNTQGYPPSDDSHLYHYSPSIVTNSPPTTPTPDPITQDYPPSDDENLHRHPPSIATNSPRNPAKHPAKRYDPHRGPNPNPSHPSNPRPRPSSSARENGLGVKWSFWNPFGTGVSSTKKNPSSGGRDQHRKKGGGQWERPRKKT
ncbi:MAG: hypothetical protein Q9202_005410 [Teloschistes flavicans]